MAGKRKQQATLRQTLAAVSKRAAPPSATAPSLTRVAQLAVIPPPVVGSLEQDLRKALQEVCAAVAESAVVDCVVGVDVELGGAGEACRTSRRVPKPSRKLMDAELAGDMHRVGRAAPPPAANETHKDEKNKKVLEYLGKLQRLTCDSKSLPRSVTQALVEVLLAEGASDEAAAAAFRLLQQEARAAPPCSVDPTGEAPVLVVNENCWTPLGTKPRPLALLLDLMKAAAACVAGGAGMAPRSSMLLAHLLELLQCDLLARLRVHTALPDKRSNGALQLLEDSWLWRVYDEDLSNWGQRVDLLQLCVRIIAAKPLGTAGERHNALISRSDLVSLARVLLSLTLELYSALEGGGAYGASSSRTRKADCANDRFMIDSVLTEALMGHHMPELKRPESKQALLLALPPRDATRLLCCVLGLYDKIRINISGLNITYTAALEPLVQYLAYSKGRNEANFMWVDPVMVLEYIEHDWAWAKQVVFASGSGRELDGLLTYVLCLVTSALQCEGCGVDTVALVAGLKRLRAKMEEGKHHLEALDATVLCHCLCLDELVQQATMA